MLYSENSHILTLEDVENFAAYLYNERKVAFTPDDDFSEYVSSVDGTRTFSDEETALFNRLMDECINVCEEENTDVYDLMGSLCPA